MPKTGHFILHSNVMPPLTAGRYELVSEQTGLPFTVAPEHTHVHVAAPRFTMPTDQILSTFPPANAEGAFGDRLPQIVLKRRTLPWERNPAGLADASETPWLALVVVAEGEAQLSTATPVAQCVTPGTSLLDPSEKDVEQGLYLAVTETVLKKIFPCQEDLPLLVHVREVDINDTELANGDDDGWLAVVLANRLPVFDTAAGKPVRYMACLVNVEGQLASLPLPEPPDDHFMFELAQDWSVLAAIDPMVGPDSRVMGGGGLDLGAVVRSGVLDAGPPGAVRAPGPLGQRAATKAVAATAIDGAAAMPQQPLAKQWSSVTEKVASVAADPDAKRLVRDTMAYGFRYPIELVALERMFRFPVLAHWSFTTTDGATFETLMQDIDVGLLGTVPEPKEGAPPAGRPAPEVVETGHVGLGHRSRRGDAVRAWYRGPLVPFPTLRQPDPDGPPPLAHSADQLRRVVPDGREDLALAAAFEIGRLLGLSQLSIVSALLRFRGEQFGAGRVRELLTQVSPFVIPELVHQRADFSRFIAVQMIGEMVRRPDQMIGPRRPIADPGRELLVRGDLDEVIASGLGFDLTEIRKVSERIGVLAAVAQAAVPVGNADGNIPLDKQVIAGMRGALRGELNRAIGIAAPQLFTPRGGPGGPRRGRAAPAPRGPDPLDELIERIEAEDEEGEES